MIDTLKFYNKLKENLDPGAALTVAEILGQVYSELSDSVTKTEFNELREAVAENTKIIKELAEAQKRTEKRVEELAEAQAKTETALQRLTQRVDKISQELGGISNTIGYSLENESYSRLKPILKKRFGIEVEKLYRKNIVYTLDRFDEINIYGEARRNGQELVVIGECKAQFGPRDVKKFLKLIERVKKHLQAEVFPLVLAHQFHPRAEAEFAKIQIPIFWSYELLEE